MNMLIQNLAENLDKLTKEKHEIFIGYFTGEEYLGFERYKLIRRGKLYITTNSSNLFKVKGSYNKTIMEFDILDEKDIIEQSNE